MPVDIRPFFNITACLIVHAAIVESVLVEVMCYRSKPSYACTIAGAPIKIQCASTGSCQCFNYLSWNVVRIVIITPNADPRILKRVFDVPLSRIWDADRVITIVVAICVARVSLTSIMEINSSRPEACVGWCVVIMHWPIRTRNIAGYILDDVVLFSNHLGVLGVDEIGNLF